jgi:uncharacterized repeat protein (TIGR01451 family)
MTGRPHAPRIATTLAFALVLAAACVAAWAFWRAAGVGTASAVTGSLSASAISVPASGLATVTVTWTQQASLEPVSPENSSITYSVERRLAGGSWSAVAGGGCSGARPYGTTSCTDAPPVTGSYGYRVVASYRTWTATSTEAGPASVTVDTTAPTVSAQLTPAPNAAGWNGTSPVAVALSADDGGGSGVAGIAYTTDGSDPATSGTAQAYAAPLSIAATTTIRYFATDVFGNASAVQAQLVRIDTAAPANAVTLSGVSGGAFKSGATVYYRGAASGSLTLTNAVSDSGSSGSASSATAALSGTATGWTHSPSLVSLPAGGPYVSSPFSWSALTTTSPGETVTGSDAAGNTTATALTFTDDSVAPAGGTVDATGLGGTGGRYATSTTLSIAFSAGTDAGSGLAGSGAQLLRATASLGDGNCGAYGAYAQVGADDPASPAGSTVPVDHTCYRYRYVVLDRVGNQATFTSPDIKVDTAAPHPDFLQPITSPETVRAGPARLTAGDIDNDGDQDIVMANLFALTASVLINNGVGGFRESLVISNGGSLDVGLGRFDTDANLDLVVLYQGTSPANGVLVIFKGGGDGSFTYLGAPNSLVSTGVRSTSLAVGDFNGDAIDDVAVVNSQNDANTQIGTVATYLGNPAGNDAFTSSTPAQTQSVQIGATDVAWADFDGGARDLVVTNYASSSISLLSGNGTGFGAPTHIAAGAPVFYLDTAYLDSGTNRDIVATVANSNPSSVRTLFGNGVGGFPVQTTTPAATAGTYSPFAVVARDLDSDGDIDVAIANGGSNSVSVLANDGAGALTIAPGSPETGIGAAGTLPYGLVGADFDGSGYDDLAVTPIFTDPGELRILLNQSGTKANLSITQTDAPDPVTTAGQSLTYALTVTNAGPGTPSSVKVTDRLPTGVAFNAAASSATCSAVGTAPVTVTCDYGAVASGSPEAQQIVVTTSAAAVSPLTNRATVAGNLADPTPADNTSSTTTTVTDGTGPSGGSVDASGLVGTGGRYAPSTALSIVLAKGTDPAGLAASGAQLRRSTGTLSSSGVPNGNCTAYTASALVATDPASPVADTVPAAQACYRYEYVVADALGNSTTYTSPDIKIDTSAPAAPGLAFSAFTNTSATGAILYYRSSAASGAFTLTASASDTSSGIASFAFPALAAGWSASAGALGVVTYSWSAANPAAPSGVQNATATNHAGLTSPAAGFTLTSDVTAPAGGSLSYTDGWFTSPSVSVSFTPGTDGGSGPNAASRLLQRSDATLAGGACGSYGGYATVTGGTNPTSPFADTSVASGSCYQYRYLASDNVGNQATYASATAAVAKVDAAPPAISRAVAARTDGSSPGTIRQGGDYYIHAQVTDASLSTVTANTSGFDTGVTAASLSATGGPWTVGGLSYSHRSALLTANTPLTTGASYNYTVTATDTPGNVTGPTSYSVTIETYASVMSGTSGLVSYWRLNDGALAGDEFSDIAGTVLSGHTGAIGATWTVVSGQARTAVITAAGRLRKETGSGGAQYHASAVPASANYLVRGDVYVASVLATDAIGVVGRQDISGTGQTFYLARYTVANTRWELGRVVDGALTLIGTGTGTGYYTQTLAVGSTYRVGLQMNGTAISLLVDGVTRITATDSAITAAGRGGVRFGTGSSTASPSDTAGLHLDDFRIVSLTTTAADSGGASPGAFTNGPLLGEAGALAGASDRAARFDGVNDHVSVPDAAALRPSAITLEAWVKPNSGIPDYSSIAAKTTLSTWDDGYGMYYWGGNAYFWINDEATISARATVVPTGAWTHLVGSYDGATVRIYMNGVLTQELAYALPIAHSTSPLLIGGAANAGARYWPGSLDEVAIYGRALSAAEVLSRYKAGAGTG